MQDIWKLFPKLIEQKINALLDEAEPNRFKSFQLYKTCQAENLWKDDFQKFADCLSDFYSLPKSERTKSKFDFYLDRPMHKSVFNEFALNFRTCTIDSSRLTGLSSWAHNMMRINLRTNSVIISIDVITRTLKQITNPPIFEKAQDIEFDDFCNAWKRIVFNLFGKKYDAELNYILKQLKALQDERKLAENQPKFVPQIFLTQTEVEWCKSVKTAAEEFSPMPKYPLSRGPEKEHLRQLLKIVQLYSVVMSSETEELKVHREKVRDTLLFRCEEIEQLRAK